jgi:hypothetical protein
MSKLNRLKSLKSRLHNVQNIKNNTQRRARTRTLIQMGGILNMVGLPQLCGINEGDDLQLDLENQDKAATLLGMLARLNESLFNTQNIEIDNDMLDDFKQCGIRMLKDYVVQKNRV